MKIDYFDLVVVGATKTGFVAAEAARQRGMSTCIIDCTTQPYDYDPLWQRLLVEARSCFEQDASIESARCRSRSAIRNSWSEIASLAREFSNRNTRDSHLSTGSAKFVRGNPTVKSGQLVELADGARIHTTAVIVATGATPRHPDRFNCDGSGIFDRAQFLLNGQSSRSVCIVGADWLGCEWAFVCAAAGANVTLVDRRSRLLRAFDLDIRLVLQERLHELGVDIVLGEEILSIDQDEHGASYVRLASGRMEVAESVLLIAGDRANTHGLGLRECGCELGSNGHVRVAENFESTTSGVYCVGSASDASAIGQADSLQAHLAVSEISGDSTEDAIAATPTILRCAEESGTCGLTAEACSVLDIPVFVGRANTDSMRDGRNRIAKAVVDSSSSRLLGVQLLGPGSSEAACLAAHLVDHTVDQRLCAELSGCEDTMTDVLCRALRSALIDSSPQYGLQAIST